MKNNTIITIVFYLLLTASSTAFQLDTGACKETRMYSAQIGNNFTEIYFWKTFLFDGHSKRQSDYSYGYSFGNLMNCLAERKETQDWDVQLIGARYANDAEARFTRFMNITDKEFCNSASNLLLEYCDPTSFEKNSKKKEKKIQEETSFLADEFDTIPALDSVTETTESKVETKSIKEKLLDLKNLLDEGLISQDQYDEKSSKILNEF